MAIQKKDTDTIMEWICQCLSLNVEKRSKLAESGLMSLTVRQLQFLWTILGDDDPDRTFRLNILEGEKVSPISEPVRKEHWTIAIWEILQDPRKMDSFGFSLDYDKPKDWEDSPLDTVMTCTGNHFVMSDPSNFCVSVDLLSRPDGDPTLILSAICYYGHEYKEMETSAQWINAITSKHTPKVNNVHFMSSMFRLVTDESFDNKEETMISWTSDLAICHPLRVV